VRGDSVRGVRTVRGLLAGLPLRVRLAALACCAAAAGAAAMGLACSQAARSGLMWQADQQLRAYADQLTSHPFTAMPAGPGPGGAASGAFVIEVVSGNQLVIVSGADGRPGPAVAGIPGRAGQLGVVPASKGTGSWLVVARAVRYSASRIMFTYGSDGYFLHVTSTSRPGIHGTLVVGLDLASVTRAITRITVSVVAVGGAAVLIVAFAALALIRAILRPVAQAETVAAGVVARGLARQVPGGRAGSLAGGLARSVNGLASRLDDARMSALAARASSDRLRAAMASACRELRRPVSVIRGCAEYYRLTRPPAAGQLDRMMSRIAGEAARIDAIIDDLACTGRDQPQPGRPFHDFTSGPGVAAVEEPADSGGCQA
jgi:two-component system, OmpR family, sensor kinase